MHTFALVVLLNVIATDCKQAADEVGGAQDAKTDGIRLLFRSEWSSALIRYAAADNEWVELPLSDVHSSGGLWKEVSIDTSGPIEFVMTDGNGDYNKSSEGTNYTIPGPGVYRLENQRILPPPVREEIP